MRYSYSVDHQINSNSRAHVYLYRSPIGSRTDITIVGLPVDCPALTDRKLILGREGVFGNGYWQSMTATVDETRSPVLPRTSAHHPHSIDFTSCSHLHVILQVGILPRHLQSLIQATTTACMKALSRNLQVAREGADIFDM